MNKKERFYSVNGENLTLADSIELFALGICENIAKEEKETEKILQKCKVLDSLSNALIAIRM